MKILYSCPINPVKLASPGQHVASVFNELRRSGHSMTLIHQGPLLAAVSQSEQFPLNLKRRKWLGRIVSDVRYAFALIKLLRAERFDRVYHRMEKWSILPLLAFRFFRIPTVLEVNSDLRVELTSLDAGPTVRLVYPFSERLQVLLCHRVLAVSEGIGQKLRRNHGKYKDKVVVVENGADTALFQPIDRDEACRRTGLDPNLQYVIFTGSFQPWQGVETLIDSADSVLNELSGVRFLLIGEGPSRDQIELQIENGSHDSEILLFSWKEPEQLANYLAASSICVAPYSMNASLDPLPPESDTSKVFMKCSPLKIYTYMAMGKPVIASGFLDGGQRLLDWNVGVSFKPGDSEELAFKIVELLRDTEKSARLGCAAFQRVRDHHTWEAVVKKIERLTLTH